MNEKKFSKLVKSLRYKNFLYRLSEIFGEWSNALEVKSKEYRWNRVSCNCKKNGLREIGDKVIITQEMIDWNRENSKYKVREKEYLNRFEVGRLGHIESYRFDENGFMVASIWDDGGSFETSVEFLKRND